jgi:hypothetical protein
MKPVGSVGGDDNTLRCEAGRFATAPSSELLRARFAGDDDPTQYDATRVGLDPEGYATEGKGAEEEEEEE